MIILFITFKLTNVFVDDQSKALKFYTEVLGFVKKSDITQGKFRWLTVVSPEEPEGTQLLLEPNDNPAAKTLSGIHIQARNPCGDVLCHCITSIFSFFVIFGT